MSAEQYPMHNNMQYEEDDESDEDDSPPPRAHGARSEHIAGARRVKQRRKSHQKPEGADQMRQAFSKRKRGLILKAYQLYKLTDSKVLLFIVNDKGNSWAYSTPGFGSVLAAEQVEAFRELAGANKPMTEIHLHPKVDAADLAIDDRSQFDIIYPYDNVNNPYGNIQTQRTAMQAVPNPSNPLKPKPRANKGAPPTSQAFHPSADPNQPLSIGDLSFQIPEELINTLNTGGNLGGPPGYGSSMAGGLDPSMDSHRVNQSHLQMGSRHEDLRMGGTVMSHPLNETKDPMMQPPPSKRQQLQAHEPSTAGAWGGGGGGGMSQHQGQYGPPSYPPAPASQYPSLINPGPYQTLTSISDEGLQRNHSQVYPNSIPHGLSLPNPSQDNQQPIWGLNQPSMSQGSYGSRSVGVGGGGLGSSLQGQVVRDADGNLYRIIQDMAPMANPEQPLGLYSSSSHQGLNGPGLSSHAGQAPSYVQQQQAPSASFGFGYGFSSGPGQGPQGPTNSQSTRGFSSHQQ